MSNWVTVSRTEHANYGYLPLTDYRFSASRPIVPLLVSELSLALPHYVLGFVQKEEQVHLVGLLGQRKGSHLYLHPDGRWLGRYIPAVLRAYPFALGFSQQGDHVLQIQSNHLVTEGGKPLFDSQGQLSEAALMVVNFLSECEKNRQGTQKACQALAQAEVLRPWEEGDHGQWAKGLLQFDEAALNALSPQQFHALRGVPMAIAYAQMFSMTQTEQLALRARLLEEQDYVPENLDSLFGNDDIFSYNLDS